MGIHEFVNNRVHKYYWDDDHNCAVSTLLVLSEYFKSKINKQVIDAAAGIGGIGEYGAQCGLVSGAIMFPGIRGKEKGWDGDQITDLSRKYADEFHRKFESLECKILRPEGFKPENPPNICEKLTGEAIIFDIYFIKESFEKKR